MTSTGDVRNLVIIGSGPAGLTAAIYTARANLAPLVIEGEPSSTSDQPGGQLMLTTDVENYPGFPEGVMGPELMENFRNQAARFGAEFLTERVSRVDLSQRPFSIWVGDPAASEPTFRAQSIIVSTGAQSLLLGVEREEALIGHGVSTCATCDGFFFRGQHIAVVGGGDTAIEEATFLTKFADTGHPRPPPRPAAGLEDHAGPGPGQPEDPLPVEQHGRVARRRREACGRQPVATRSPARSPTLDVTGLFVAIGHQPNTGLFKGQLELDGNGYLITHDGTRYERPGRLRLRRRAGPDLPPGHHRRRLRLHGGHRRRAVARVHRPRHHRSTRLVTSGPPTSQEEPMAADGILTLTDSTFDEQINASDVPVVVDFWADWCGPCKMIAPIVGELAVEQAGKLQFAKIDVDANPDASLRYGVMSIPTLLVFKDGQVAKRLVGAKGKGQLLEELGDFI